MDARAKIPVMLPVDNPTKSTWQDPPDPIANLRTTEELPTTADVVIVGSGITGAAVAWHLLQDAGPGTAGRTIVMLEARQACSGATGRNGGHTKAASYRSFRANASRLGPAAAAQITRLELANICATHAFAAAHGLADAAESRPGLRTADLVQDAAQWAAARDGVAALQAALGPAVDDDAAAYALHDGAAEVAKSFGFSCNDGCEGAVEYEAGSISAYRFTVGVLRLCLERGLNLQTTTPALGLARHHDGGWAVRTPRGSVVARRVVLATNGYTAALLPDLFQGAIVPLRGTVAALRRGQGLPSDLGATYSFVYERGYEYLVGRLPREDGGAGDIVIGGGLTLAKDQGLNEYGTVNDGEVDGDIAAYLAEAAPRYFGSAWGADDPAGRLRAVWSGIMGYSADGLPFVGEIPGQEGLWMSCSFQGHGMVLCWMCARALVEMMEGRDGEALEEWFPGAFRVTEERLRTKFEGRLHTTAK